MKKLSPISCRGTTKKLLEKVGVVPGGTRRVIPILGGTFARTGLKGKILPGGADHHLQPDGFTQLEARYVLQTDQAELLYVTNRGMRPGPPAVLQRLNGGERVDPNLIYFRTAATLETAAPRLQWMARSIFVCVGERYPTEVVVRFNRVLQASRSSSSNQPFWRFNCIVIYSVSF